MANPIVERLWELVTGKPYTTTRSMAAEFGPTWATRYPELADIPDHELIRADIATLVARIEAIRSQSPTVAIEAERLLVDALTGRIAGAELAEVKR